MLTQALLLAVILAAPAPKEAAKPAPWAEFRGLNGEGHYTGPDTPVNWGSDKNVSWKTPISGQGWSSPVLLKNQLFLTSAIQQKDHYDLNVLCVNAADGKIVWEKTAFQSDIKSAERLHKKNSKASPTPVTDGERVYFHFGHLGTCAYDLKGEQVWKTTDYTYDPQHGNGGSPILVDDKLVFSCDGNDKQILVALHTKTGKEAWKTDRGSKAKLKFSFATAQVIEHDKKKQIISPASDFVCGYDPENGKELWRANYPKPGWSVICRPVYSHGLVIISSGYINQHLVAIDPSGNGDVTETHIKWIYKKHAPNTPTPLIVGDELYSVSDSGVMVCLDIKTGKVHWEERLKGDGHSSSPILVNKYIYVTSENGTGLVIEPSKTELKILHENLMKEKTFATILPDDGALYLRTESTLYKFAEKK
jgi:outer membrane protein assembly factor BamB